MAPAKSPDPFWLGPVGLDVSKFQGNVNWLAVKQAGYSFAFIKASEGVGFEDPKFARNWTESRAAGMLVGAYHFARVSKSPTIEEDAKKEAEWFASRLGNATNTLPPVLDVEWDKNADKVISGAEMIRWCEIFTQTLGSITGRIPTIYLGRNFWRWRLLRTTKLAHLQLWQVDVNSKTNPIKIEAWKRWTFWQWSFKQPLPGSTNTKIDANRFNGSDEDLAALASKPEPAVVTSDATTLVEEIPQVAPIDVPWWDKLAESLNIVNRYISEHARRGG